MLLSRIPFRPAVLASLLGLAACSGRVPLAKTELRPDSLRYVIGKSAPFTGTLVVPMDAATGVSVEMPFVNGLRDGQAKGVHKNGKPAFAETWKAGKREGTRQEWDSVGHPSRTEHFVNGLREGVMQDFSPSGMVIVERPMHAGEQEGVVKTWYASGKLRSESHYTTGKLNGVMTLLYENGQKKYEGLFAEGKPDGVVQEWWPNGKLKASTTWAKGVASGPYTRWYDSGQKQEEGAFKGDERVSPKYWNFDGKPMAKPGTDPGPANPHPPAS